MEQGQGMLLRRYGDGAGRFAVMGVGVRRAGGGVVGAPAFWFTQPPLSARIPTHSLRQPHAHLSTFRFILTSPLPCCFSRTYYE